MIQASGRQHVLPVFQYKEFRGMFFARIDEVCSMQGMMRW